MQGDIVSSLKSLVHGGDDLDGGIQSQSVLHGQEGVIAHDLHAQSSACVGHQNADGAQADDGQGLAHDLGAHESGLALFHHSSDISAGSSLLLDPGDALGDLTGSQQQSGDGQLLDAVGVCAGGVEDNDASLGSAVQGDVVDACACTGDALQGSGEVVVVQLSGTDQDGVLVCHVVSDLETIVQLSQADLGDLVHGLNLIHGKTFLSESFV